MTEKEIIAENLIDIARSLEIISITLIALAILFALACFIWILH